MRFNFAWLALAIGLIGCAGQLYAFHGTLLQPPLSIADFALTNQDGQTTRLSEYRGKLVLLFFGYTHCPDACPLTLAHFKNIRNDLGADAAQVRFVLVTVDPERDTPAQLKEYLSQFDASFIGLTAGADALAPVYRAYGVSIEQILDDEHSHDAVAHTSAVFLLDGQGQIRLIYTDIPWEDITSDIRFLLKQQA